MTEVKLPPLMEGLQLSELKMVRAVGFHHACAYHKTKIGLPQGKKQLEKSKICL